jgi:hypothetical protein
LMAEAANGDGKDTPTSRPEKGTILHSCVLFESALRKLLMVPPTPAGNTQKVVLVVAVVAKLNPPTLDAPPAELERVSS